MLFFFIGLIASIVGAICGIGGGVIIKPLLDIFAVADVSAISFLSGCSVLGMSLYSVSCSFIKKERAVNLKTGTPLAIGAAAGGVIGNQIFTYLKSLSNSPNQIGAVQAALLGIITLGTLIYLIFKKRIPTLKVTSLPACIAIGVMLGFFSSFLGIGGGPINLIVLYFFFSMETKSAAANSLYIILFSQLANLLTALIANTVPAFDWASLVFIVAGGIGGGIIGRRLSKKMSGGNVSRLLEITMVIIVAFCCYNVYQYI